MTLIWGPHRYPIMTSRSTPKRVPANVAKLIVAASETHADLLYATGFFAPDPFIFFIHRGRKFLVMSDLEIDRAKVQARVHTVLPMSRYERLLRAASVKNTDLAAVLARVLADRRIHSVIVPGSFPLGLAEQLRKSGLRVHVSLGPFFPRREIKTPEEAGEIRKSQLAAEAGVAAAIQVLRDSKIRLDGALWWNGSRLTSQTLKQQISVAALEHGCVASRTIVACGEQGWILTRKGVGCSRRTNPS